MYRITSPPRAVIRAAEVLAVTCPGRWPGSGLGKWQGHAGGSSAEVSAAGVMSVVNGSPTAADDLHRPDRHVPDRRALRVGLVRLPRLGHGRVTGFTRSPELRHRGVCDPELGPPCPPVTAGRPVSAEATSAGVGYRPRVGSGIGGVRGVDWEGLVFDCPVFARPAPPIITLGQLRQRVGVTRWGCVGGRRGPGR
jgi:hypothetical protein